VNNLDKNKIESSNVPNNTKEKTTELIIVFLIKGNPIVKHCIKPEELIG